MSSETEYQEQISTYSWEQLLELWKKIENRNTPDWTPGKAFEYLVLRIFQLDGVEVKWPYSVKNQNGDIIEQIDGVIYVENLARLVESKDYEKSINIEPIAKLRNQLLRRPSNCIGCVFSRNGFTDPAIILSDYISPQTIILWEGKEIEFALKKRKISEFLIDKFHKSIEWAIPNFNIIPDEEL